jgi:carbonic anhydrase
MSKVLNEVLLANRGYVAGFEKGDLAMPPARQFAILTCMDARLDPAKYAGLSEGHTDCGMETFTDEIMRGLLASSLKTASVDANGWHDCCEGGGSHEAKHISWLTISDLAQSVVEDVIRIKNHPLVPSDIPVYGYIYDVKTGGLVEVPEATKIGAVR